MDINTENLFGRAFDMSSGIIYYPVRHHSAACAMHLEKVIEEYQPDSILIEGSADADMLIPYIVNENTVPPVCIYYSYDDKKGLVDENCEKYRAYYPFLEYSPEMTALKKGSKTGAEIHFIDIPYGEMLVNEKRKELQFDFGKEGYDGEASYTRKIAEDNGCRSFSEFWESRFETAAPHKDTNEFVKSVTALGYYMRQFGKSDEADYMKNLRREKYMADNIAKYSKGHKRTLVVAGAFHILGLLEPDKSIKALKKCDSSAKSIYLMPYTFFEADSKSGYGAGIPFPSFYQKIWEKFHDEKIPNDKVYEETVLEYIVKTARYTRSKQAVSVPDEVNAFAMAKSLAVLRDKSSAGVYELIDGVRSTFVKGDINTTATFELDFLYKQLTGMGIGKIVSDEKIVPPVVEEFHAQCRKYRIKTNTIAYQDMTLETVKKPAHYEKSCFLHRMEFLNTGFCRMTAGADYVNEKDTNLIREQWRCRYSTDVETALTDLSVFGANIYQICSTLIEKKFKDNMTAAELGKIMIHIHVMDMDIIIAEKNAVMRSVILNDSDFISVCGFIHSVKRLIVMNKLRNGAFPPVLCEYMSTAFEKAINLLDAVKSADDDKLDDVCKGIRMLYSVSMEYGEICHAENLFDEIERIYTDSECKNEIYGVMTAVMFKSGRISTEEYCRIIGSYLETADGNDASLFLCGIFMAGRDILFTDKKLLFIIDTVISGMDADEFKAVLPNLRYAFTNFIPSETERISGMIAQHYSVSEDTISGSCTYSREDVEKASECDRKASLNLRKWGLD